MQLLKVYKQYSEKCNIDLVVFMSLLPKLSCLDSIFGVFEIFKCFLNILWLGFINILLDQLEQIIDII
jgi:hypothetical protein